MGHYSIKHDKGGYDIVIVEHEKSKIHIDMAKIPGGYETVGALLLLYKPDFLL